MKVANFVGEAIKLRLFVTVRFSSCSVCNAVSSSLMTTQWTIVMRYFLAFFQRLFGAPTSAPEDHLGGPIDLSDVPYCLGLLTQDHE